MDDFGRYLLFALIGMLLVAPLVGRFIDGPIERVLAWWEHRRS